MKKIITIFMLIGLAACNSASQKQNNTTAPQTQNKTVYTCTMHSEVKTDKPGTCPKCGMDLVEKED